jgi:hypothetical protein
MAHHGFLKFALQALVRSFKGAWAAAWIISSIATIVGGAIWFKWPLPNATMNLLVGLLPLVVFVGVMIAGPLVAAFRMYEELEEWSSAQIAALRTQVSGRSLDTRRLAAVREQLSKLDLNQRSAIEHIVASGGLTADRFHDFCRRHGFNVNLGVLAQKVNFLTLDEVTGAPQVQPDMAEIVNYAVLELTPAQRKP